MRINGDKAKDGVASEPTKVVIAFPIFYPFKIRYCSFHTIRGKDEESGKLKENFL